MPFFPPIYIKAEPRAASAPSGEITHFSVSTIVKAALTFLEGISGLMPLALQSQNLGLQIKPERIRERQAVGGGITYDPLLLKGKGPEVCRAPINFSVPTSSFCSPQLLCWAVQPQISIKYRFLWDGPCVWGTARAGCNPPSPSPPEE